MSAHQGAPPTVGVDDRGLTAAVELLGAGGAVIIPTDTVYGLAVLAEDEAAVDRLFALKRRPRDLSIAVLVADLAQAAMIASANDIERGLARELWPGALTLILQRRPQVGNWVGRDDGSVGIRCPDHDFVRALAARVGPLATTSANLSGEPTPLGAIEAANSLAGPVDLVVDGGSCAGHASTVARIETDGTPTILRAGAINAANLGEIAQKLL